MTSSAFRLSLALAFLPAAFSHADVTLPSVLSSGMVLQRDKPVPVWGKAAPGEQVSVIFAGQTKTATAGADGRWKTALDAMPANDVPQTLAVQGANRVELTDVLVGEVWLGSGQSNMQWPVKASVNGEAETNAANFPKIRLFNVPNISSSEKEDTVPATWTACTPQSAAGFSAALFFMGRDLHAELKVPVGLINSSWGGSRIEPWTPEEGFAQVPSQSDIVKVIRSARPGTGEYRNTMSAWLREQQEWIKTASAAVEKNQAVPPMPQQPGPPPLGFQGIVGLYNAMIHPLVPYAIRGAVWYQGESNNGEGMLYFDRQKALINGWRAVWGQGDFPFYVVQLAPFNYGGQPHEKGRENTSLADIWESQAEVVKQIPNTGMAVITDVTNLDDIHPANKQEVGRRLGLIALAKDYGRQGLEYSGPVYSGHSVEGGKIRLKFEHVGTGLATRTGQAPDWFEIAGADGKYVAATAAIEGNEVIVSSPQIAEPKSARMGWSQLAMPSLMNKEGLPASSFRTAR